MENIELDSLLNKHRLSFHWGAAAKTWFLVGQMKGGNTLHTTKPRQAEDINKAKADAVRFIHELFQD
ncbi:MAG TPA: hypothetical protein VMT46_09075 [Anaerolineaceae bacterium]|nr:hypothetical protein [Anaerolineaceae bacterium]